MCLALSLAAAAILAPVVVHAQSVTVDCEAIYDRPDHGETFYESNPTHLDRRGAFVWASGSPRDVGMDETILNRGIDDLLSVPTAFGVLVVRDGKLVAERYGNGSAADHANNIHSASKSVMSALVGIAIREGYIKSVDQKVADFLPAYFDDGDTDKAQITVAHLLTMSAGLSWSEDLTEFEIQTEEDWVAAIVSRTLMDTPGSAFHYSTGLTHVLSAVLSAATGMSTCDFAHRYLFAPLDITAEHWGRDPQGVYSGGYNLYLTPREMAAFGQLYLRGGRWQGEQVVPSAWVGESWQPHQTDDEDYSYGYLWWLRAFGGHQVAFAWGWAGQMIFVVPDLDIVVVVTGDSSGEASPLDDGNFASRAMAFLRDGVIAAVE